MAVKTHNSCGNISISDNAIAKIAAHASMDCYGIVELVSPHFADSLFVLFGKGRGAKGIKVSTVSDRIFIDVFVIIKFGVSIQAVADSLKETIKYNVEKFTGMIVDTVNVNIAGVKL